MRLRYKNIALLLTTSCILTSCANNNYENKVINKTEIIEDTNIEESEKISTEQIENNNTEETSEIIEDIKKTEEITDEQVIEYINKVGDEINNCTDGITESAKRGFIKVVDFLFYGGEIGGRTFESLKDETKTKVLEIYDSISTYLDEKLPIWKESLGEKYESAKIYWEENKDDIFDMLKSGKQKIKDWYQDFKNNH